MSTRLIALEIDDGLTVILGPGVVIRRSGLRKGQCELFTPGQSAAAEGFVIDRDYADVVDEIEEALAQLTEGQMAETIEPEEEKH